MTWGWAWAGAGEEKGPKGCRVGRGLLLLNSFSHRQLLLSPRVFPKFNEGRAAASQVSALPHASGPELEHPCTPDQVRGPSGQPRGEAGGAAV